MINLIYRNRNNCLILYFLIISIIIKIIFDVDDAKGDNIKN